MKILITGSNGLLGQKLVYKLREKAGVKLIATARGANRLVEHSGYIYEEMDITQAEQVNAVLAKHLPDCVINTAAATNVDACELDQPMATLLNVTSVKNIVEALEALQEKNKNYKPHLIHLSTDFIFDGSHGPLTEDEKPNPLSHYALTKLQAEEVVTRSKLHWAIARTMLVYGIVDNASRSNIVLWAKQNLEQGKNINVVDDQFRTPTLAEDLADGCILIAEKKAQGVFNISGKDFMSILELVCRVADYYHLDKSLIKPSKSADIKQPAKRPPKTGFIIEKARRELGYEPHSFEEGIRIMDEQVRKMNSK